MRGPLATGSVLAALWLAAAHGCALAADAAVTTATDGAVTAGDAVAEALARNPALLSARKELDVALGRLAAAKRLNAHNPQVGASAGYRDFDDGGSSVQPAAQLSLEVEVAGQRGLRIAAARHEVARVEAEIADAERRLRAQVRQAFDRALHAGERLAVARAGAALAARLAEASAARFERGEVAKMEPNMAAIRAAQARGEELAAERGRGEAVRALEALMGREPRGGLRLAGSLTSSRAAITRELDATGVDELVAIARRERPDVRASLAEVERLRDERELAGRLAIPNPTFGAFYEEEDEAEGARDRIVGAGLTVPLPLFDRRGAERAEADGRYAQAQLGVQAKAQALRAEIADAWAAHRAARELLEAYENGALERIDESLRLVETAYREGKIDVLELIAAQDDLLAARAARIDAWLEYRLARTALEQAVGAPLTARAREEDSR